MNSDVLFQPFSHPKLSLPNRIAMAPMTRGFSPNGVPGKNVEQYYRRRADGGVGLIISEGTTINHPAASESSNIPVFFGEQALAGWQKIIESVHAGGAKMVPQLWHVGSIRRKGLGHVPEAESASPSGLVGPGKLKLQPLSVEEIEQLIEAYAQSAQYAQELGFDGVELHGAHGYLIDQFFWEGTNVREDHYGSGENGGSIEARTQFCVEIVKAIRRKCGDNFPIILRYSQWKQQDFAAKLAHTPEELQRFLTPLSNAGVDIFHCSTRRFWEPEFEGSQLNLAGWTKKITGKPSISVGSVGLNEEFVTTYRGGQAEAVGIDNLLERMEAQEFDIIAIGRALLVNPTWPQLVRDGQLDQLKTFNKDVLAELV